MQPSLTQVLGDFVAMTKTSDIPAAVVTRAKVSLVHNLTMAMAGRSRETVAHVMAKQCWPLPAQATLLHDGTLVSAEAAAFANGALMHARSQDDTHAGSTSHPGAAVMPAALAIAEAEGRTGAEFLTAVVLGYEILARIGRDFDHLVTARGFRAAAVFGGFGSTVAATKLLRLSAEQSGHALGLAAHLAGGLTQVWEEGSAEGPLQLGFAARNGLLAAQAAQAGATSARAILEGRRGFYRAYAGTSEPAVEALDGLGETWQFAEITVKPYPVCAILQGPVDAMLHLLRTHAIAPSAVQEVVLELNPYEAAYPGVDNPGPFASNIATKMSAHFSMALTLSDRRMTMDDLFRFGDSTIEALASRVRVVPDATVPMRLSRLQVHTLDGRTYVREVVVPVGQPSFDEVAAFARSLTVEIGTGVERIDRLVAEITNLDKAPNLAGLITSLCADRSNV